jgi:pyruvate,water dikinase
MVSSVIEAARSAGRKIGICGQAPSDYPEFTRFLVERGITSISLNPDALIRGLEAIAEAERRPGPAGSREAPASPSGRTPVPGQS